MAIGSRGGEVNITSGFGVRSSGDNVHLGGGSSRDEAGGNVAISADTSSSEDGGDINIGGGNGFRKGLISLTGSNAISGDGKHFHDHWSLEVYTSLTFCLESY